MGMIEGTESSVMHFQLKQGDLLMQMSDGIAHSRNCERYVKGVPDKILLLPLQDSPDGMRPGSCPEWRRPEPCENALRI